MTTTNAPLKRNPDLVALHRQLIALVTALDLAMGDADAGQVKVLAEQIAGVNARVTAVGRQLFARGSQEITEAASAVASVLPDIEHTLADLARIDAFVEGMTGMLALVDHAVATAKMIA